MTGVNVSMFVDQFLFPQRTATIPIPVQGYDAGLSLDAGLSRATDISVRCTRGRGQEVVAGIDAEGVGAWQLRETGQYRIRATLVHEATNAIRLKARFEATGFGPGMAGGKGTMLFQDARYVSAGGLSLEARLIFFQTDSYDARIYEFENDVPGAFSVPVLYGTGRRWYILFRYDLLPGVLFSLKWAETQKEGVRTLGSGQDAIEGDRETRVTVQMDIGL
jgi:hypothetical protein